MRYFRKQLEVKNKCMVGIDSAWHNLSAVPGYYMNFQER